MTYLSQRKLLAKEIWVDTWNVCYLENANNVGGILRLNTFPKIAMRQFTNMIEKTYL
jgi:hypothetical protein